MQLQERFHKYGIVQTYSNRDVLLRLIGGHFMDKAVKAVKQNSTLRGTEDNWDMRIKAHNMRSSANKQDLHLFASNVLLYKPTKFLNLG